MLRILTAYPEEHEGTVAERLSFLTLRDGATAFTQSPNVRSPAAAPRPPAEDIGVALAYRTTDAGICVSEQVFQIDFTGVGFGLGNPFSFAQLFDNGNSFAALLFGCRF